jgi:hypothetical protein
MRERLGREGATLCGKLLMKCISAVARENLYLSLMLVQAAVVERTTELRVKYNGDGGGEKDTHSSHKSFSTLEFFF